MDQVLFSDITICPLGGVAPSSVYLRPLISQYLVELESVYMDADASLRTQVTNTVRACFSALCQIRSVRRALPQHALLTLVRTLVITRLDPCNSVLAGISGYLQDQDRLQSVLNASAWLVYSRRTSEHTTTALGTARVCLLYTSDAADE